MTRQVHLNAMFHTAGEHLVGWRHPSSPADPSLDLAYATRLVQRAEAARFDALFLADLTGIPDSKPSVLERVAVTNDSFEPITLLAALAAVTSRIGLVATASSSYNEPYTVARAFASLDHISGGRAGWNLVTSLNDSEARNFGYDTHLLHADRYRRAEEFYDVVEGLWDSFDDDAFVHDAASGRYFDPERIHRLDHRGERFRVAGPLNVPRPPQGRPVIAQAGASEPGRALAARIGEIVFIAGGGLEGSREQYADLKARAAALGRDPDGLLVLPALSPIVAPTRAEAEDRFAELEALLDPVVALGDLEYWLGGVDLTRYDLDGPLPELPPSNKSVSTAERIYTEARASGLSIRQFAKASSATNDRYTIGTPTDIADHIEEWSTTGAADGFNVVFAQLPDTLDAFADLVIPELQRRGLFRTEYEGTTLREHLGLARPASRWAA
ncbi:LLM class flavin-dependent oxidoreductase [uncultured Amnibacterium sp.]|uniref:LLM class flavin-dependent oxidoreductase n=1 Tax=uncultured Amnibacterium sp. TaxID=1631851 RepID=UPI0035CADC36